MPEAAPAQSIRLLGIDPGLRTTGFGVIDVNGDQLRYVACGAIKPNTNASLPERIKNIFDDVREVILTYQPTIASIEKVFVNVNPQATLLLGQARGAALAALVSADLAVHEYTALQIKQSVVGYGKAQKAQVQLMVKQLLKLASEPSTDAADALACAICHAHSARLTHALSLAVPLLQARGTRIRKGRVIG